MHHGEVNLEKVFMSEFWINFLVIPRSDYLNEMRNLLIVIQKKVKSSIDSQNVKFDERAHQVTTAKWEQKIMGK